MINPIFNKQILEMLMRPMPTSTPPFNPNAGPGPQIGPTMPGQVRGGMLNRTSPVDMDTILGFESAIPPIQGPGMAGMSPDVPMAPTAPWSGSETAGKRQDLNIQGLKDEYAKLQETVKKPRAKAKLKQTFGKQDLPIALIGGLLSYLAGGKNRGQSVDQFVQSFAGFNKQRADEQNQAEMQRVEEENRAAELEIASQKIGIDLKKLEYDEQEKALERFRKEEDRVKGLEDYAKKVEIDLGADLKKIGAKDAGAVAKGEAARLQDRLLTLDDKELGSRGIAYLKLAMADGVLDVSDMDYISKTFLNSDTVNEKKARGVNALNAIKTRTAEEMLPITKRLAEAGITLREDEHKKFNALFPLMDDVQLAELIYKKKQSENITNLIKNRDKNTAVAELRADNSKYTGAVGLYRALMTASSQQASDLRSRLAQEDSALATLEFDLRKAEADYKSETNRDQKEAYGKRVEELKKSITAQQAIVTPIKESIKSNQEEYGSVVEQLQNLQKAVESGGSGGDPPVSKNLVESASNAGFKGEALATAIAIAMAESGGRADAHNPNASTGDNSYGLWQINMLGNMGPERRKKYGLSSNEDLWNPDTNAKIAYQMSGGGKNWKAWTTYTSGKYKQYMADARRLAGISEPEYQDRPVRGGPIPMAGGKKNNPNLVKAASGLGMPKKNTTPDKKKETKPATKKTRTVKIGDKTITVDES